MSDSTAGEEWVGRTVGGRYLIEKKLGAGAMGAVFIANQISMDRKVALKLLHANHQGSESLVKRFEREMKATSKVDHQNTVRVYDFGAAITFWIGASIISMLLAASLWNTRIRD